VAESNAFVLEDGEVLELSETGGSVVGRVPAGHIFVDGRHRYDAQSGILEERRRLSREGVAFVTITVDKKTRKALGPPRLISSGFLEAIDSDAILETASQEAHSTLERYSSAGLKWDDVKTKVAESVSRVLHEETGMRPSVFALIEEV
jgi:ribonuclease J